MNTTSSGNIEFTCWACGADLTVDATLFGISGPCPRCRAHVTALPPPLPIGPTESSSDESDRETGKPPASAELAPQFVIVPPPRRPWQPDEETEPTVRGWNAPPRRRVLVVTLSMGLFGVTGTRALHMLHQQSEAYFGSDATSAIVSYNPRGAR